MDDKELTIRNLNKSPSTTLSFHKDWRSSISKPKIRIIHIFATEIIKTDIANFRDLVQRLTGKQADRGKGKKINKLSTMRELGHSRVVLPENPIPRKAEHFDILRGLESRGSLVVKEEQGGYLKDFADLDDGFIHELRGLSHPHIDAPLPHALLWHADDISLLESN